MMKTRYVLPVTLLVLVTAGAFAHSESAQHPEMQSGLPGDSAQLQKEAAVVGVWRAQQDGLPWVTLNITNEGGALQGAILFYLRRRDDAGKVTASPGTPEPLLHPHFDGRVLTFAVSHRRAHPPATLQDPPVPFRLEVTNTNRVRLVNEEDAGVTTSFERRVY
jgi:hypothetical protein